MDSSNRPRPGWLAACALGVLPVAAWSATLHFDVAPGARQFSTPVPEGNYRVTVHLGSSKAAGSTTVLAEQRRLMLEEVATRRRQSLERSFIVNVRTPQLAPPPANAPGATGVRLKPRELGSPNWDDRLTLEFAGRAPQVTAVDVEPVDVPTLYLAGDSTVTDQPTAPSASWGQMLTRFFAPRMAIANHAESGETLKSFVTELRLDKLLSNLKSGDWVMIQFGHNDEKAQWPQTYVDASNTYRSWLRVYLSEVRRRGATPILVTSPERRNFDAAGHIVPSHGDYPAAVREVARQEGVALIDLTEMSARFYEALGPAVAPRAFADGGQDKTHHDEYGAYALARMVIEGLRACDPQTVAGLGAYIADDAGRYDPSHPAPPGDVAIEAHR